MANITMFSFHTALALELLAALAAGFLIMVAWRWGAEVKRLGTVLGGLGLVAAVSSMTCTTYYGVAYWNEGVFSPATVKSQSAMMENMSSMQGMMKNMMSMHGGGLMGQMPGHSPSASDDKSMH